jgi:photosystem II stability/assembly factor-like uncharacterized protein
MKTKHFILAVLLAILSLPAISQEDSFLGRFPENLKNRNVFKRFTWFYQQRAYPYDTFPQQIYRREMSREILKAKNATNRDAGQCKWRCIGPDNLQSYDFSWVSGRTRALAVHPTDPKTVYIGAACGGIWKTKDGGTSWMDIGSDMESLSYGAIAIDPAHPDVVYAGSGETNVLGWFVHFDGRGLFKSTDGGTNWMKITDGFGDFTSFSDIAVSPYNSDIVLSALASGSFFTGHPRPNEGIWKSTDAGNTWTRTLDEIDAWDILFHPVNPRIVYAAVGGMQADAGFYISNDEGDTWVRSSNGLPDPLEIGRMQIDISKSDPTVIYALIYKVLNYSTGFGITTAYKSVDAGSTWVQISAGIPLGADNFSYDQGSYDLCIAVDPTNKDHVFIGNIMIHETTNGSTFLIPARFYGVHPDIHQIIYAPSDPEYMYIVCDGGVYKSTNGGQACSSANHGLATLQYYRIASSPIDSLTVIGGTQDNGVMITSDGGENWHYLFNADGMDSFFDYDDPSIVYTSSFQGQFFKSTNGGYHFESFATIPGPWITPFLMHATNHNWLYTGGHHFLRYNGTQFQVLVQSIVQEPAYVSAIAQSKLNTDNIILATSLSYVSYIPLSADSLIMVKISTDGGYNWLDITGNIPGETRWISRVVADPNDDSTFYVLRTGFSPGNKVYRTKDLGTSWENLSGDLPDLPCSDLFIDPREEGHMYIAADFGVYRTTDGGTTWVYQGDGIPIVPVFDFDYNEYGSNRILRVGTHGRSIYQTYLTPYEGIGEADQDILPVRHYPEPFNDYTIFSYSLKEPSQVCLEVYDSFGQHAGQTVIENQPEGTHQLTWNAKELPAGIYYYRLTASGLRPTASGKLVKIR